MSGLTSGKMSHVKGLYTGYLLPMGLHFLENSFWTLGLWVLEKSIVLISMIFQNSWKNTTPHKADWWINIWDIVQYFLGLVTSNCQCSVRLLMVHQSIQIVQFNEISFTSLHEKLSWPLVQSDCWLTKASSPKYSLLVQLDLWLVTLVRANKSTSLTRGWFYLSEKFEVFSSPIRLAQVWFHLSKLQT